MRERRHVNELHVPLPSTCKFEGRKAAGVCARVEQMQFPVARLPSSHDKLIRHGLALHPAKHTDRVTDFQSVGILLRNDLSGVIELFLVIVGELVSHLKDSAHVFGITFAHSFVQLVVVLSVSEGVGDAVVLEIIIEPRPSNQSL